MRCRVNFKVVADHALVTSDAVYLESAQPLSGKALQAAAVQAIAQEYDLGIVDLTSISVEETVEAAISRRYRE